MKALKSGQRTCRFIVTVTGPEELSSQELRDYVGQELSAARGQFYPEDPRHHIHLEKVVGYTQPRKPK